MAAKHNLDVISDGTTIIAVEYAGGVVIAADSRTSCRSYVSNRLADKLTRLTDHIYCCRSGAAAQTQTMADLITHLLNVQQMSMGKPPLVYDAASRFRELIYTHRSSTVASIIVAGWDELHGGQVYSIPISGFLCREPCALGGSGSSYLHGFVSAEHRTGMSKDECMRFVLKAVRLAIKHDCHSGGVVRIGVINKDGMQAHVIAADELQHFSFANELLWKLEFGADES
ncbi:maker9 [Drosophila busckii]|uniref:proteasome endopeptidase complex n=1 Tax=Drosophila busckii TaxID=30019 RepID=A0A0M3QUF7_DROBS|nr:proteasome subunit beta type-6 [Drosophila busckii]ALC40583.1 maker9 [Drosophila busckii]